ncbi:MAG: hypothetical protein LBS75_06765 [Synergistaceae bacterium]|jgi:hypothetical protein|nr:hypothetical protein [Synergistaceae bacterium]
MKRAVMVLGIIAFFVASAASFGEAGQVGHIDSVVTPPVAISSESVEVAPTELAEALGVGETVTIISAVNTTVDETVLTSVDVEVKKTIQPTVSSAVITPVVLPPLPVTVTFVNDVAAVAFAVRETSLENDLDLAEGETIEGIKNEIYLYLINPDYTLYQVPDDEFEILVKDGKVNIVFLLKKANALSSASERAALAEESIVIEPVIVRIKDVDQPSGGGGGGCDAGFSGAAALVALAGGLWLRGKARKG